MITHKSWHINHDAVSLRRIVRLAIQQVDSKSFFLFSFRCTAFSSVVVFS